MKRKLLLGLFLVLSVAISQAQITVTNSIFPVSGDILYTKSTANLGNITTMSAAGPNQTWDYSSLTSGTFRTTTIAAASTGSQAALFPTADLTYYDHNLNGQVYVSTANDTKQLLGFDGDFLQIGVPLAIPFSDYETLVKTPLNYQDTYTDSSGFKVAIAVNDYSQLDSLIQTLGAPPSLIVDSIRVTFDVITDHEVDAWGQMSLDYIGATDVLRVKQTRRTNTLVEMKGTLIGFPTGWIDPSTQGIAVPFGGLDTLTFYEFFNDNSKESIALVSMDSTQVGIEAIEYKSDPAVGTFGISTIKTGNVRAFPNPVMDNLSLEFKGFNAGKYEVRIYNIVGRQLWNKRYDISGNRTVKIKVDDFPKGTYLYSVIDSNGRTVTTKRIMIVKP